MFKRNCAICGPNAPRKVLYRQNFKRSQLDERIFSARRLPDRLHYQTLKCLKCGLIFSSPVLGEDKIYELYKESRFTYAKRTRDLTETYGYWLHELDHYGAKKSRLLEIGCGNGFFLLEARRQGYKEVFGVEPSIEAVNKAPRWVKANIKSDVFKNTLFPKNYFDVVCFFQTFDHIPEPNKFLKDCFAVLKPGGLILAFNHNAESIPARLFGEKFPIIDVEHTYLYSPKTMRKIFQKNGFRVLNAQPASNIYPIEYLLFMFPFPRKVKKLLIKIVKQAGLAKIRLRLKIGNMALIAQKPQK